MIGTVHIGWVGRKPLDTRSVTGILGMKPHEDGITQS